jgi:hypothetical protein
MNNPKFRQQWILDELKKAPTTSYVEMFAKYSQEFAKSNKTFDKDWNKANTELKEYQQIINNAKLEESIATEKEAVKRNILSKLDAMEILTEIAIGKPKIIAGEIVFPSAGERRGAIETMSKIEGWNAPTKQETKIEANFSDIVIMPKKNE